MPLSWPPPVEQLIDFIAFLSLEDYSPTTARLYLAGIGFHCKMDQLQDTTQNFVLKKLLTGFERNRKRVDTRLPITPQLLGKIINICPYICANKFESCLFSAAFSLAYFGFFRVGELTACSKRAMIHALPFSSVSFTDNNRTLEIYIPHSKTDQSGRGATVFIPEVGGPICPVYHMSAYLRVRPSGNNQLFCHFNKEPLTRYQFSAMLKKAIMQLNLGLVGYRPHSFRIGAASVSSRLGFTEDTIKELGRWQSGAYKKYIRVPAAKLALG